MKVCIECERPTKGRNDLCNSCEHNHSRATQRNKDREFKFEMRDKQVEVDARGIMRVPVCR